MGCKAGQYNKFIVTPSLEVWPNKTKEPPSPNEVRLTLLDTLPSISMSQGQGKGYGKGKVN